MRKPPLKAAQRRAILHRLVSMYTMAGYDCDTADSCYLAWVRQRGSTSLDSLFEGVRLEVTRVGNVQSEVHFAREFHVKVLEMLRVAAPMIYKEVVA
jgi:hypothetical protein